VGNLKGWDELEPADLQRVEASVSAAVSCASDIQACTLWHFATVPSQKSSR